MTVRRTIATAILMRLRRRLNGTRLRTCSKNCNQRSPRLFCLLLCSASGGRSTISISNSLYAVRSITLCSGFSSSNHSRAPSNRCFPCSTSSLEVSRTLERTRRPSATRATERPASSSGAKSVISSSNLIVWKIIKFVVKFAHTRHQWSAMNCAPTIVSQLVPFQEWPLALHPVHLQRYRHLLTFAMFVSRPGDRRRHRQIWSAADLRRQTK